MSKQQSGLAPAKAIELNTLVEIAPDAIVSRTIMRNNAGNVTLFAFAAGQELSEHSAPFDALVQVVEGAATIIIDKEEHDVSAGEVILMPKDIPHAVRAKESFKMLLVMLKGE